MARLRRQARKTLTRKQRRALRKAAWRKQQAKRRTRKSRGGRGRARKVRRTRTVRGRRVARRNPRRPSLRKIQQAKSWLQKRVSGPRGMSADDAWGFRDEADYAHVEKYYRMRGTKRPGRKSRRNPHANWHVESGRYGRRPVILAYDNRKGLILVKNKTGVIKRFHYTKKTRNRAQTAAGNFAESLHNDADMNF
jgi:hypothetical protein